MLNTKLVGKTVPRKQSCTKDQTLNFNLPEMVLNLSEHKEIPWFPNNNKF